MPKKIVITGGPASGKTSIIKALETMGYPCLHEISREVTLQGRQNGIQHLFISDPLLFSEKLLEGRIAQYVQAENLTDNFVFIDRGIPDVVAYLDRVGTDYPNPFTKACIEYTYDEVFILPPWEEIYSQDNERYEDFKEATILFEYLKKTYNTYEYQHVHVPCGSIEERVQYIIDHLNK